MWGKHVIYKHNQMYSRLDLIHMWATERGQNKGSNQVEHILHWVPVFLGSILDCVSLKESLCNFRKIGTWIDHYVEKNKNTTATPSKETKAHHQQEKLPSNSDLLIIHVTCFCPNHYSLILLNSCFSKDVIHHLQCSLTWSNESFWLHKINILGAIQLLMFKETLHKCQISLIIFTVNRRSP